MNTNGIDGLGGAVGVCTGWVRAGAGAGRVLCRISFDQKGVVETPTHPLVRFYFYSPLFSSSYLPYIPSSSRVFFSHNLSIFGWLVDVSFVRPSPHARFLVFALYFSTLAISSWFTHMPMRPPTHGLFLLVFHVRLHTYIEPPLPLLFLWRPTLPYPPPGPPTRSSRRAARLSRFSSDFFFGIAAGTRLAGCVGWLDVVK
jgi:hypothetical protein